MYVAAKSDYKASYFFMGITEIERIGVGVKFRVYESQEGKEYIEPIFSTSYEYKRRNYESPDYVFLTKEGG